MSTLQLRHAIAEYLSQIDDVSFLKAIKIIIEEKANTKIYNLSEDQKLRVEQSREQYKKGQTVSHEELNKDVDQWLNANSIEF
jgi:hypothetical protein